MKLWELTSIFRDQPEILKKALQARQETQLLEWIDNIDDITSRQDRSILDRIIDNSLCVAILADHDGILYQSSKYLRTYPIENEIQLGFAEVFKKYGGSIIEETLEKGIAVIPK